MTGTGEEDAIRELVDFIGARLAEDRKGALEASPGFWKVENGGREVWTERRTPTLVVHFTWPQEARHIAWWSQQRVLDEVNAKGLLLELHAERFRRGGELARRAGAADPRFTVLVAPGLEGGLAVVREWTCICGSGDDGEWHTLACTISNTPEEVWNSTEGEEGEVSEASSGVTA
jgi:hypothetical protein